MSEATPRVVISGIGIASPLGLGHADHWRRLVGGESAVAGWEPGAFDPGPVQVGARIADFNVAPFLKDRKMARLLSAASAFGFAASALAVTDSGLDVETIPAARRALYCQTGMFQVESRDLAPIVEHCCEDGALSLAQFGQKGMSVINPFLPIKTLPNMGLGALSIHFDFQGPNLVAGPFNAQGAMLLALAMHALLENEADVALVVGGDAPFNMMTLSSLLALDVLDTRELPHLGLFDPANAGMILGEGGVALVLEREDDVLARGGQVLARLNLPEMAGAPQARHGYAQDAGALSHVLTQALATGPVDAVWADGCGVPATDRLEKAALDAVLSGLPTVGSKAQTGAWLGAGFLLDVAHGALSLATGELPGLPAAHPQAVLVHGLDLAGAACAVRLTAASA